MEKGMDLLIKILRSEVPVVFKHSTSQMDYPSEVDFLLDTAEGSQYKGCACR
jgi:hypothetical protein